MNLSNVELINIGLSLIAILLSIPFHEYGHAFTATYLGDTLPRQQGRLTLNPGAHFEPTGLIFIVLGTISGAVGAGVPILGWGKPVMVNPYNLRYGRRGMSLTSIAGPAMNIVLATVVATLLYIFALLNLDIPALIVQFCVDMVIVNIGLAIFNLIPVPPLDGFGILNGIVSNFWVSYLAPIAVRGWTILVALVMIIPFASGFLLGNSGNQINVLSSVLGPAITFLDQLYFSPTILTYLGQHKLTLLPGGSSQMTLLAGSAVCSLAYRFWRKDKCACSQTTQASTSGNSSDLT